MTTDDGQPKEMDSFLALAEERGLWHPVNHPEIQAWSQRVLALSMQKFVDVLVSFGFFSSRFIANPAHRL